MKHTIILLFALLTACAGLNIQENYTSTMPKKMIFEQYRNTIYQREGNYAQLLFSRSDYNFQDELDIRFDDELLSISDDYHKVYKSLRLPSRVRDFTIVWTHANKPQSIIVRDFLFEPNILYIVKFSVIKDIRYLWIEKNNGKVVYGKRHII